MVLPYHRTGRPHSTRQKTLKGALVIGRKRQDARSQCEGQCDCNQQHSPRGQLLRRGKKGAVKFCKKNDETLKKIQVIVHYPDIYFVLCNAVYMCGLFPRQWFTGGRGALLQKIVLPFLVLSNFKRQDLKHCYVYTLCKKSSHHFRPSVFGYL